MTDQILALNLIHCESFTAYNRRKVVKSETLLGDTWSLSTHRHVQYRSQLECNFHLPDDVFGGCHRYDQSLFAVLVSNAYKDEMRRYCLSRDSAGRYPAIVQRAEEKSV